MCTDPEEARERLAKLDAQYERLVDTLAMQHFHRGGAADVARKNLSRRSSERGSRSSGRIGSRRVSMPKRRSSA